MFLSALVLLALVGCGSQYPNYADVESDRFALVNCQIIRTPKGFPDVEITTIRDKVTNRQYAMIRDSHGLQLIEVPKLPPEAK
jgi:uncharacterized protein (DUF2461 family)